MRVTGGKVVLLLSVALASLGLAGAGSGGGTQEERIVFESDRGGTTYGIYSMRVDGSDVKPLSTGWSEGWPDWSPNGQQIAFSSSRPPNFGIFVMNADGSDQTQLTQGPDSYPAWSPDGTHIAFLSQREAGNEDIWVMRSDGTEITRLTTDAAYDAWPTWSPDGSRIAFIRGTGGNDYDLYVMKADGTDATRITDTPGYPEFNPDWSPDGTRIAFARDGDNRPFLDNLAIVTIAPDGTGEQTPFSSGGYAGAPSWSPDSQKIVFFYRAQGNYDLYKMNRDGSGITRLTFEPSIENRSDWGTVQVPPPPPPPPAPLPPPPPPPPAPVPPPPPPPPPPAPPPPSPTGSPCIVPRVIALRLLIARRKIQRAHCKLGRVRYKHSRRNRVGRVIWQSPRPGAVKSMSWRVTLLIGRR